MYLFYPGAVPVFVLSLASGDFFASPIQASHELQLALGHGRYVAAIPPCPPPKAIPLPKARPARRFGGHGREDGPWYLG